MEEKEPGGAQVSGLMIVVDSGEITELGNEGRQVCGGGCGRLEMRGSGFSSETTEEALSGGDF